MRKKWLNHIALVLILPGTFLLAQSNAESDTQKNADAPTITITNLDVNDKTLKLSYQIKNEAKYDIWILVGFDKYDLSANVFMDNNGQTIIIRRRFDVPSSGGNGSVYGRYVRIYPGDRKTESVSLAIPVYPKRGFAEGRKSKGLEYATRIAIEIGFYSGDLPGMISNLIEEAEKVSDINTDDEWSTFLYYFGEVLNINKINEGLRQRDEEILIPYTHQTLKGEQILRTTIDGLLVPYEEKESQSESNLPDLSSCTRVEIQYKPSMLEYFFPYVGQQNILSAAEMRSLQSNEVFIIKDPELIKTFSQDISHGIYADGLVRIISTAHVACFSGDELLNSFKIYNDESIMTKGSRRLKYFKGIKSLRMLTPNIQPLESRMQCAANLKDLWYRLRLYNRAERKLVRYPPIKKQNVYPPKPNEWADAILLVYRAAKMSDEDIMRPFSCPGAGEGKCHYAMNPNCKYDSPGDMVLLFETKAGWNQHGGPELFTFDNHAPKGGCILLNNGTVKFIRVEDELNALRWK